ncbi:MAG: transketolase [Acidimicrobiia bacterium]|nr:transketolase [Acidimicrobiia bacterium]MYC58497.1 transketolase [Acidimicrobiia bacterium]MYG94255.1 transketolase [Acidimicrobiia bacterium]MYI30397.1 transketolase [Acidimicrobiia bacterium]
MDAPHQARSGHQGTAMAMAPLAHVLWSRILRYDAEDPTWPDRDRFVLSAGHASILLYAMLHLTGHGLSLQDLRNFRQWDSRTPGHPEADHTVGIEVTTGPLGQGLANAVGMAVAERWLRHRFGIEVCNHRVFVLCSDGDFSEGISHEAASLAGHQALGRLICIYDDNHITIDGTTELALSDDAKKRFEAYGWHVVDLGDNSEEIDVIEAGLHAAIANDQAPSLLILRSHIGFPSPNLTDNPEAHGYALFDEEIAATKTMMGLPIKEPFHVPTEVAEAYLACGRSGTSQRIAWQQRVDALGSTRQFYEACLRGKGLLGWHDELPQWDPQESLATRKASSACLNAMLDVVPGLITGGADLTGNTGTNLIDQEPLSPSYPAGRQIFFGVREHAMGAVLNGAALHGGVVPVGGTFLVFSDYMRPAVRLAALSGAHSIFVWSHDSVGVGEDGPTHQPIEQVMSLRAIPGLRVFRPADANEVVQAWHLAIDMQGPSAMVLTRQNVPVLVGTANGNGVSRGAYALSDVADPDVILVGTGSEVAVCVEAAERLGAIGVAAKVVSMPCWELFEAQDDSYQVEVLNPGVPSLSLEAGVTLGWSRWVDSAVGIDRFGASASGATVLDKLGINASNLVSKAQDLLTRSRE